jgi:hypothetical protein
MSTTTSTKHALVIESFCKRQWDKTYIGTRLTGISHDDLEKLINTHYMSKGGEASLMPGYAPFCKHVFVSNPYPSIKVSVLPITKDNISWLRSGYEARTPKELKVLTRWFPVEMVPGGFDGLPTAKYLDVILYSREQIIKENAAMGIVETGSSTAPWGIISVKGQEESFELPMTPITMMRNAVGKEEGGSGVSLNRDEYNRAVDYWETRAVVR